MSPTKRSGSRARPARSTHSSTLIVTVVLSSSAAATAPVATAARTPAVVPRANPYATATETTNTAATNHNHHGALSRSR